jgi:hypothetical protein
MKKIWN